MVKKIITNNKFNLIFVLILGVCLRLAMPLRGYNIDMDLWRYITNISNADINIYTEAAQTEMFKYQYAPIWLNILHIMDNFIGAISSSPVLDLRWKITVLLSLVDVSIFIILHRLYSFRVGVLFFLNPISIIITGYQIQFDNMAILFGLIAVILLNQNKITFTYLFGLFSLGFSLCVKHIFFIFPLWLAFKEKKWPKKILLLLIPYLIFLASFIPYLPEGLNGIINNVFKYRSWIHNAPFWKLFAPNVIASKQSFHFPLFLITLLCLGLIWKSKKILETFNLYLISLVNFASSICNHYLAICVPSIAVNWNWGYALYTIVTSIHLLFDFDALHFHFMGRQIGYAGHHYYLPIIFLSLGFYIQIFGNQEFKKILKKLYSIFLWIKKEIRGQLINPF